MHQVGPPSRAAQGPAPQQAARAGGVRPGPLTADAWPCAVVPGEPPLAITHPRLLSWTPKRRPARPWRRRGPGRGCLPLVRGAGQRRPCPQGAMMHPGRLSCLRPVRAGSLPWPLPRPARRGRIPRPRQEPPILRSPGGLRPGRWCRRSLFPDAQGPPHAAQDPPPPPPPPPAADRRPDPGLGRRSPRPHRPLAPRRRRPRPGRPQREVAQPQRRPARRPPRPARR
jgi:hypothetical protein